MTVAGTNHPAAEHHDALTRSGGDVLRDANPGRVAGLAVRTVLRTGLGVYLTLLAGASSRRSRPSTNRDVLLTLNFYADAWVRALLRSLVLSGRCDRVRLVTTMAVDGFDGVDVIHPPAWLSRVCGSTIARLLTFTRVALRDRPMLVGGVHLLFNGLVAALVARLARTRSLYLCVGGPNEVAGGGLWSENRAFRYLPGPDARLEQQLLRAVRAFDIVVTVGTRAAAFFGTRSPGPAIATIPAGVDTAFYQPAAEPRNIDIIIVARLVPLKRIDLFLETVRAVADAVPGVQAVVVGTGPTLEAAEGLADRLGLRSQVTFAGRRSDVAQWLGRSRVFLLPSDTEGVSTSLLEAMVCGTVPVVSDVGDLADAVEDRVNGILVRDRTATGFAAPIIELLTMPARWSQLSAAAQRTAERFRPATLAARWATLLDGLENRDEAGSGGPASFTGPRPIRDREAI